MSQPITYHTTVIWKGTHLGHISMGNGPEMDFSAPPDAEGAKGLLTPEDAFVGAVNSCIMMMFIWACERLKLELVSYRCSAEGSKQVEIDHTESFTKVRLYPEISVRSGSDTPANLERRVSRALVSAQKYSLVANSIRSAIEIQPVVTIIR